MLKGFFAAVQWNNVVLAEAETNIVLKAIPIIDLCTKPQDHVIPLWGPVVIIANLTVKTGDCNELYVLDFVFAPKVNRFGFY